MAIPVPSGRDAAVLKYDLLTALTVWAYRQPKRVMTSALRLIGLITARYDWRRDEISVGRAWLAGFWHVDPSTAKREMKRLRDLGLISLVAAGVRGRVSRYRLERGAILALAQPVGDAVGTDFSDRVAVLIPACPTAPDALGPGNVVPFERPGQASAGQGAGPRVEPGVDPDATPDSIALHRAMERDAPAIYRAWFSGAALRRHEGHLCVVLPSAYRAAYVRTNHTRLLGDICARLWPGEGPLIVVSGDG